MSDKLGKKIKFTLIMKNGKEIRSLKELQECFDIYEVMTHFIDGKLLRWLKNRNYYKEFECINNLRRIYEKASDAGNIDAVKSIIFKNIYSTFDIPVEKDKIDSIDIEIIKRDCEIKRIIKEKTDDKDALNNITHVASNQKCLNDLLKKFKNEKDKRIYLLKSDNERFFEVDFQQINEGYVFIGLKNKDEERSRVIVKLFLDGKEVEDAEVENNLTRIRKSFSNVNIITRKNEMNIFNIGNNDKNEEIIRYLEYNDSLKTKEIWQADNSRKVVRDRLIKYMDARFPLLYINSFEEDKADEIIYSVKESRNVFEWNAEGFFTYKMNERKKWKGAWGLQQTLTMLIHDQLVFENYHQEMMRINERKVSRDYDLKNSILILKDVHNLFKNDIIVAQLKYLAQKIYNGELEDCNIIIISPVLNIPIELENYLTILEVGYLTSDEIADLIERFCDAQCSPVPKGVLLTKLINALKGLSEFDIINILSLAISNDGEITLDELDLIMDQKKRMIKKTNILQMIDVEDSMDNLGGLDLLKKWLRQKAKIFADLENARKFGVTTPKGVLIAGMPGCGKSLCAKVTANEFNLPLLCLDMGRIMGKYVGESESNMRRALSIADAVSPCILWIDEMEKAFSGIGSENSGSDVTMRLFGTFLTWMQEKKSAVFVVATANDATKLPSELLRKGRFDELFYVNLPNHKERQDILKIHIKHKRGEDWDNFSDEDIDELAKVAERYSGADIEGAIRYAIEEAFIDGKQPLNKERVKRAIENVIPISKVKKSAIQSMREMYRKNNFQKATSQDPNDADNPKEKVKIILEIKKKQLKERFEKVKNKNIFSKPSQQGDSNGEEENLS